MHNELLLHNYQDDWNEEVWTYWVLGGLEGSGILSHWNAASTLKVVLEFWQKAKHVLNNLLHYMSDIPLSGIAQE